ncbi:hypothetical protein ACOMHN_012353 [Nucella lapillus]
MATRIDHLTGRPPAFEATGDAHTVSVHWTAWLEEFEAFADSVGLFITPDDDANKQQRRALLPYVAGKEQTKAMGDSLEAKVDRVKGEYGQKYPKIKGECYRWGSGDQYGSSPNCPVKDKSCRRCGGANLFAKKCQSKKKEGEREEQKFSRRGPSQRGGRKGHHSGRRIHHLEADESDSDDVGTAHIFMTRSPSSSNRITVIIGGITVDMIIDSGSDMNIIDEKLWGFKAEETTLNTNYASAQRNCSRTLQTLHCKQSGASMQRRRQADRAYKPST